MAGATTNFSELALEPAASASRGAALQWIDQDFLAFHASMKPDKPACLALATGERVTYAELHRRANRAVAAIRRQAGDVRGKPLAILARNSVDFLVFVVAVYRCGAILHPLN